MNLEFGRPTDCTGRKPRETRTYDLLDRLGIAYGRVDHEAAESMEACAVIERVLEAPICKNLFLSNRQGTAFYLLLMPADKPFRTKELSAQIGSSRLSFATPEHMEQYLGLSPGSVSVLGLRNDRGGRVRLLIDEDLLADEWIGCHPLVNTTTLRLCISDLLTRFLPAVKHGYSPVRLLGGDAP